MPELQPKLIDYYDTHPINEQEILAKLSARGDDLERLSQVQLKDFDQDHYGGTDAVDVLADAAGIDEINCGARCLLRSGRPGALACAYPSLPGNRP